MRERDREGERQKGRETETERYSGRYTKTVIQTDRDRYGDTEGEREDWVGKWDRVKKP